MNELIIFLTAYILVGTLISIRLSKPFFESFNLSLLERVLFFVATVMLYPLLIIPEPEEMTDEEWLDWQW